MDGVELGNARILKPGKLRWLRAILWMVALFVGLGAGFVLFVNLLFYSAAAASDGAFARAKDAPEPLKFVVIGLGALLVIGLYRAAVRYAENRPVSELSIRHLPAELLAGLFIGGVLMAASIGVLWAMGWAIVTPRPIAQWLPAIRESIQSGVVEEILFRLVVLRLTWRAFGAWWALAFSALLFGALHLANPNASIFAALCIAFEAGILLATFYILTGRAWAPIGVHAGWNFTQGWIFGAAVSGSPGGFAGGPLLTVPAPGVPELFSGGSFGPEASLPGLLVCTAAGLSLLWLAWRKGAMERAD
ncbi:MAG: CPBP family intramembrane glutamic endopeptidase [Pseudomonadota bacterium]